MPSILKGTKVVAFTHYATGPMAAQYLGSFGADVIKIEPPGRGDFNRLENADPKGRLGGLNPYFLNLNKNQRCIVLDLKNQAGNKAARKLAEGADVLIENYRPGVLDRLGFGYDELSKRNPGLVYCSISAYDPLGPSRNEPGQDLLLQALGGLASMTGPSDGPPIAAGGYIIDSYSGMQAVIGILGALIYRNLTGEGQWVRADMISCAIHMLGSETGYILNVGGEYERSGSAGVSHVYEAAPYGSFRTRDGAIMVSGQPFPDAIREALQNLGTLEEVDGYLTGEGIRIHRDAIAMAFANGIGKLTSEEAISRIEPSGIWVVPIRTVAEALEDPGVVAANIVRTVDGFAGPHRVVAEPVKMSKTPVEIYRSAPGYGEHTREILEEIGYGGREIEQLLSEGAAVELQE